MQSAPVLAGIRISLHPVQAPLDVEETWHWVKAGKSGAVIGMRTSPRGSQAWLRYQPKTAALELTALGEALEAQATLAGECAPLRLTQGNRLKIPAGTLFTLRPATSQALKPGDRSVQRAHELTARVTVAGNRLSIDEPADFSVLRIARVDIRAWLEQPGFSPIVVSDVVLAASEAVSNSIEHAYGVATGRDTRGARVRVEGWASDGEINLSVEDTGRWREPTKDSRRGQGLKVMRSVMDAVEVQPGPSGTTVCMKLQR